MRNNNAEIRHGGEPKLATHVFHFMRQKNHAVLFVHVRVSKCLRRRFQDAVSKQHLKYFH